MKIYTKTGDSGQTSLFGGQRITKSHQRIGAYGSIDELNAHIGNIRALLTSPGLLVSQASPSSTGSQASADTNTETDAALHRVQEELLRIGSHLATPYNPSEGIPSTLPPLRSTSVEALEQWIDQMEATLTPLRRFILPGGTPAAAATHVPRTVCRRAERHVVQLHHNEAVDPTILKYLNRLSDALFVLARVLNAQSHTSEVEWNASEDRDASSFEADHGQ